MNCVDPAAAPRDRMLAARIVAWLAGVLSAPSTLAASQARHLSATATQGLPDGTDGLIRVVVGLVIVLAVLLAAAAVMRRLRALGGSRHPGLELLAQLPLGPRERAVLLRVGERQLLLGVASGSVRALLVLDGAHGAGAPRDGADVPGGAACTPTDGSTAARRVSFAALLRRSLGL